MEQEIGQEKVLNSFKKPTFLEEIPSKIPSNCRDNLREGGQCYALAMTIPWIAARKIPKVVSSGNELYYFNKINRFGCEP